VRFLPRKNYRPVLAQMADPRSLIFWSAPRGATSIAHTYESMTWCRALGGRGEVFYLAAAMSMISDYHRHSTHDGLWLPQRPSTTPTLSLASTTLLPFRIAARLQVFSTRWDGSVVASHASSSPSDRQQLAGARVPAPLPRSISLLAFSWCSPHNDCVVRTTL
jgi:hypothetical protein